ncbi:hypothetical protein IFM89_005948 [Coptis chinensis]|uniref:Uncharacterized protein n=1 Tax=Coptis chinensis TaxID=261450 RepID=A0A835M1R1_9MAGN|nr:hypothetical protein IFM89_005948 [Coptis chinensis]
MEIQSGEKRMEEEEDYVSIKVRRLREAQKILMQRKAKSKIPLDQNNTNPQEQVEEEEDMAHSEAAAKPSLLFKATQLKRDLPEVTPTQQLVLQEKEMIEHLSDRKTLMSVRELAKGITYSEPLNTGWKPPLNIRRMSRKVCDRIRKQWHILVDGEDVPPPIKNFRDMRLLDPVLDKLKRKGLCNPSDTGPGFTGYFVWEGYDWDCVYWVWEDFGFCFAVDYGCVARGGFDADYAWGGAFWFGYLSV